MTNTNLIDSIINYGFFKHRILSIAESEELKNILLAFEKKEKKSSSYHGLVYSLFALSKVDSKIFNSEASKFIRPHLNSIFKSYKSLVFSYIRKEAEHNSEFFLHQDWNYTNEKSFQSLTGWLALQDITLEDGGMFFLKPEFRQPTLRSGSYLSKRTPSKSVTAKRLTKVSLKKGEAIFFQPSVFHGSAPNLGIDSRRVINFIVMPERAPFLHYQKINRFLAAEHFFDDSDIFDHIEVLSKGIVPKTIKNKRYIFYNEALARKRIQKNLY